MPENSASSVCASLMVAMAGAGSEPAAMFSSAAINCCVRIRLASPLTFLFSREI